MITPKPFQQTYIGNVLGLFRAAKSHFDEVKSDFERGRVFAYNGACLLKAPTGAGKTLIAGTVAEQFAKEENLVWLWFAPFKGLVGQAAMSLRDHHPGLRVRDLATGRRAAGTRSGDAFVLTWASVVARSADARKLRTDNEQLVSLDDFLADLLSCMEQQVAFNDRTLLTALAKDVQVIRVEKTHLAESLEEETRSIIQARIDLEKAERQAQLLLMRQQYLSAKELQDHLLKRLAEEFVNHGMSEVAHDDERLEAALSLILVRFPGLLKEVEKQCAARFSFTRETEPLPGFIESAEALAPSFKNLYGVLPADLNPWEVEFARLLDNDPSGTVLWWHRNPPRKKHSVAIVRPDGGRFFPDFIVGVKGRTVARDGILLIETKHAIGSVDSKIKAVIEHKDYGRALMIHWKDWHDPKNRTAMTVTYDPASDKNVLDAVFRCAAMPTY